MANLCTLQDTKSFLGILDASEDALLNLLIPSVSSAIEDYCQRTFGQQTLTETYKGTNSPYLPLNQRPVTAVSSVLLDLGAFWGSAPNAFDPTLTTLTAGTDYALVADQPDGSSKCGMLFRIGDVWPQLPAWSPGTISPGLDKTGCIRVSYTAGFAVVPTDVGLAAMLAIARIRQLATSQGSPLTGEGYEEWHASYQTAPRTSWLTPEVKSLLSRYKEQAVA